METDICVRPNDFEKKAAKVLKIKTKCVSSKQFQNNEF